MRPRSKCNFFFFKQVLYNLLTFLALNKILFFFKKKLFLLYVWVLACMMYVHHGISSSHRGQRGYLITWNSSYTCCEPPCVLGTKPSPPQDQKIVLITEPSLLSLSRIILMKNVSVVPKIREHVIYVINFSLSTMFAVN